LRTSVLGITGPGATSDLLKEYPLAYVVNSDDVEEMKKAITEMFHMEKKQSAPKVEKSYFEQFERQHQVRGLADLLGNEEA